jgi:hypothetical protein
MRSLLLACLVLVTPAAAGAALAQRAGGIRYGRTDVLTHVADLPADVREQLRQQTGLNLAVGFYYRRWSLFTEAFAFWTWDGKYVLFQGDRGFQPTDEELVAWLGKEQYDSLGKPFAYRFPPGLVTVVGLVVAIVVLVRLFPTTQARLKRLSRDHKYVEAMQVYGKNLPEGAEPSAEEKERALATAVQTLQSQGISATTARANLRLILGEIDRQRSYELRNQAVIHEENGEWDQAAEHYEQAARLRLEWDKGDCAFLLGCVQRVRDKQAKAAPPEPPEPEREA